MIRIRREVSFYVSQIDFHVTKYTPVTWCDVEESMFKNVQSAKRISLNEDNLEKLVVHCFRKNKNVT